MQARRDFDDLSVGDALPELRRGPLTLDDVWKWGSWNGVHVDPTAEGEVQQLMINGSWKQHQLVQCLRDWAGEDGWLWRLGFLFRKPDYSGDELTVFGIVSELRRFDAFGVAACDVGIRNSRGEVSTEGRALVALPYRGGPATPYPFPRGLEF